jgi:enterochelin esterase-like enzyme
LGRRGGATRRANDPFVVANADGARVPYVFLSAGDAEPLLEPVRRFDALLTRRGIAHEFHVMPGGHDWGEWNEALPALIQGIGETHSSR